MKSWFKGWFVTILTLGVVSMLYTFWQPILIGVAILVALVIGLAVLVAVVLGIRALWRRYDLNPRYKAWLPLVRRKSDK